MKVYTSNLRSVWYDSHLKQWVQHQQRGSASPLGDVECVSSRRQALKWLHDWSAEDERNERRHQQSDSDDI